MSHENTNICWLDLETTGLDANEDAILEIAAVITTPQLEEIAHYTAVVAPSVPTKRIGAIHPIVAAMHSKSGLWAESLGAALTFDKACDEVRALMFKHHAVGSPLCGSSVHFDRKFLAAQHVRLHGDFAYRNIDVSTWTELAKRLAPGVYEARPGRDSEPAHRALDDIRNSIALQRYYLQTIGWLGKAIVDDLSDGVPVVAECAAETEHSPRPSQGDREGVTVTPA